MEQAEAMPLAAEIGRRLMDGGAEAVVLAGSVVRGEASAESDIDLYAFGPRASYTLWRHSARLISITWRSPEAEREAFLTPSKAGAVIPAWRSAHILFDPRGVAADLQHAATEWTWDVIGRPRLDQYVAGEITGLAEEVHKLVGSLRSGRRWTAAVQRSILALQLAPVLSVHLRLLYETENRLWDLVAEEMGAEWRQAQDDAFAAALEPACRAALRLYAMAAQNVAHTLEPQQREVVSYAASLSA